MATALPHPLLGTLVLVLPRKISSSIQIYHVLTGKKKKKLFFVSISSSNQLFIPKLFFFPILCCIVYDDKISVVCDSFLL